MKFGGWKYRKPPDGLMESQMILCIMPHPCVFGNRCQHAHCTDELEEWKQRAKQSLEGRLYKNYSNSVAIYRQELQEKLGKLDEGSEEKSVVCELVGDYYVMCDENLFIMHTEKSKEIVWNFTVQSALEIPKRRLLRVYLKLPTQEFSLSNVYFEGKSWLQLPKQCQLWENTDNSPNYSFLSLSIRFHASKIGNYVNDIIFDFGDFPKLIRKIGVQVATEEMLTKFMDFDPEKHEINELTLLEKHKLVLPNGDTKIGLDDIRYPLPKNIATLVKFDAFKHLDTTLTKANYRQRMHTLLYIEEYQRRANLQDYRFHIDDFVECLDDSVEGDTEIFSATVRFDEYVLETLLRLVGKNGKALIRLNTYTDGSLNKEKIVYEMILLKLEKGALTFKISENLFRLVRQSVIPVDVDVCFCLVDIFDPLHHAVDKVDLKLIFPTIPSHTVLPYYRQIYGRPYLAKVHSLSDEQLQAVDIINEKEPKPLILLLGPFGAGKTKTIAKSVERILTEENSKNILICTHSNSAADLYIEEYFHPLHGTNNNQLIKPLRINWEHRYVSSVSNVTLAYCLRDLNTGLFKKPSVKDLKGHNLIISSLMTADLIVKLDLPSNYFSHIFIDEGAQAIEAEAIIPLSAATEETTVVLAGDHMQMSEDLSSNVVKDLGLGISLLERLFFYYETDSKYKLKLMKNFRSYREIVDLASHLFYDDSLESWLEKPENEPYPIHIYHVEGQEHLSTENPTYENLAEVVRVVSCIEELIKSWKSRNVEIDMSVICVTSFYPAQVKLIRKTLRRNKMSAVRVENVNNIQGLEFDYLIISTVRTNCDLTRLDEFHAVNMGFFTNPKLLNTAITRAKYQLIVVGDAIALSLIGECRACWKVIFQICNENSAFRVDSGTYDDLMAEINKNDLRLCETDQGSNIDDEETTTFEQHKFPNDGKMDITVDTKIALASPLPPTVLCQPCYPPFHMSQPPVQYQIQPQYYCSTISSDINYPLFIPVSPHPSMLMVPVDPIVRFLVDHQQALKNDKTQPSLVTSSSQTYEINPVSATHQQYEEYTLPSADTIAKQRQKVAFLSTYINYFFRRFKDQRNAKNVTNKFLTKATETLRELTDAVEDLSTHNMRLQLEQIDSDLEACYKFMDMQINDFFQTYTNGNILSNIHVDQRKTLVDKLGKCSKTVNNQDLKNRSSVARCKILTAVTFYLLLIQSECSLIDTLMEHDLSASIVNFKIEFLNSYINQIEHILDEECIFPKPIQKAKARSTEFDSVKTTANITTRNTKKIDQDLSRWFKDRKNDPCIREYVQTKHRKKAQRLPPPLSVLEILMDPPFLEYEDVCQTDNVLEGVVSFETVHDYKNLHGKVLVNQSIQVHVNGLRNNNRTLPGDVVLVKLINKRSSNKFDVPGKIVSILKRTDSTFNCKKLHQLENKVLLSPVDINGPPFLAFVKGEDINQSFYEVKFLEWPSDSKYPIGSINTTSVD